MPRAALVAAVLALSTTARGAEPRERAPADPTAARVEALVAQLERDRAAPRALASLFELEAIEDELPDLARLGPVHARVADDARAHPEVRAYARFRLAHLARARGDLRRSAAELDRLAFLSGWQIAGPFDNEGKRGFDVAFPPERGVDLAARYPGKARQVGWRALPDEALSMGFAWLGATVRPLREVVVYATTEVESPREQRARLYLGASGAVKAFVNGAPAYADGSYHEARLDQGAAEFTLRKGTNRILVKLCHEEGRLGFYARLADARGEPLRLARPAPRPAGAGEERAPRARDAALRPVRVAGVVLAAERRAGEARGSEAARARRDLAVILAGRRPGEDRERRATVEARRAAALAPRSVAARLLAATLEDDLNRRREQLEAAVEASPRDPLALTALAEHELSRGRPSRARRLLDRALAAAPGFVPARLGLAELHERTGLVARARELREDLVRSAPRHPAAIRAAAQAARAQGSLPEAARLLREALALRFDDGAARALLVQLSLDQADLEAAVRLLEDAVRLGPGELGVRLRLADLLASNGRGEQAEAAFAAALRIAPEEAEILERRGQARLRAGLTQGALADFQAALELKPQNPQLKELVRAIEPARERFERTYLYDARELARGASGRWPDEDAVVLGELKVTKAFPSGLASTFTQLVVKVQNQRGADAWRSWSASYSPERQELRVERARVLKPDGTAVESFQENDRSASEPWYRLYYDTRTRVLGFPALAPGDVLEIAVRTDDVASDNLLSDYFGDLTFFADSVRKARVDYVLLVPEGRRIFSNEPGPPIERGERVLPGGVVERRWTARDLPRIQPEPNMPGLSEIAPYVHVSTYESWDDVARFYWGLVRDQLALTPEIRDAAQRLAAEVRRQRRASNLPEAGDELALVQAAHRFVVTNTRYVGLEFGIHGYKPYRVDQVLQRRFGDCKDKASLTHALLEALGIDSRLVLLRMRRLGRLPERPASLAAFNHAIAYVPRHDLWLDGTASYSGSRDLPAEDRGATVLVVNPGQPARFGVIPDALPADNSSQSRYEVALEADGSAVVSGQARVAGMQAPNYRRAYATEHERRAHLEQAMARAFPGLAVKEVAVSDLGRLEDEVTMRFSLSSPRLAERDGDGLRFLPFGGGHRYAEGMAPLSSRRFDLVLGQPWDTRISYRYALPRGFAPASLPSPVRLDAPFGEFEASCREEGGAVVADARIQLKKGRVTAAEYPAFREFLSQVDRALARAVRLEPAGRGSRAGVP